MNDAEQRIAIAKECGWELVPPMTGQNPFVVPVWYGPHGGPARHDYLPPDYLNDLNACAEMEKMLDKDQDHPIIYWEELEKIVGCSDSNDGNEMLKVICATAAQRCEAFLRTKGLWK